MKYLFSILFIFFFQFSFGQDFYADSLKSELLAADQDSGKIILLFELSEYYQQRDIEKALNYSLKSFEVAEDLDDIEAKVQAQYNIGFAYLTKSQPLKALNHFDRTLNLTDTIAFAALVANVYEYMGKSYFMLGEIQNATTYFEKSLRIHIRNRERENQARLQNEIGHTFYEKRAYSKALSSYSKALKNYERYRNYEDIIPTMIYIGKTYEASNNLKAALAQYNRALDRSKSVKYNAGIGLAKKYIGLFLFRETAYLNAFDAQFEALKYYQETEDSTAIADIIMDICYTYLAQDSTVSAHEYALKALQFYNNIGDDNGKATVLNVLGQHFYHLIGVDEAIIYFQDALTINDRLNNKKGLVTTLLNIADLYFDEGKYDRVLTYTNRAISIAQEIHDPKSVKRASRLLAQSYGYQNQFKEAYISQQVYDSLNIEESSQRMAELSDLHQTSKQQLESEKNQIRQNSLFAIIIIGLLAFLGLGGLFYYIRQLRQKQIVFEEDLTAARQEKIRLETGIHERVRSSLQVISSILNIQTYDSKNEKTIATFQAEQSRLKAISLIQQLMYRSETVGFINFQDYTEQLTAFLENIYHDNHKFIECAVNVSPAQLEIDHALPLGLIINELVSNAYKHAFTEKHNGKIEVVLEYQNNGYQLCVRDNGNGVPTGFSQKNYGMGFKIINTLARPLKTKVEVKQTEDWNLFELNFTT